MRPSLVVSLLLLSLLFSNVQGIRLDKGSVAVQLKKQEDEESALFKRSESAVEEALLCRDGECTGKIKNRKIVTTPISTTQAIAKNVKNGGKQAQPSANGNTRNVRVDDKEVSMKVNTSANSEQQELHPDLLDIAEMDYSPARRKPPIHN